MPVESRKSAELAVGPATAPRIVSGVSRPSDAPAPAAEELVKDETLHARDARAERDATDAAPSTLESVVVAKAEAELAPPEETAPAIVDAPETEPTALEVVDPTVRDAIPAEVREEKRERQDETEADLAAPLSDEISIPPVGDLVVEEFFSEGDVGKHLEAIAEVEEPVVDAKVARKLAPEVVQRRTRLAKYVTWAVGGAGALCVVALVRAFAAPHASAIAEVKPASALVAANETPVTKEATREREREPEAKQPAAPAAEPMPAPAEPQKAEAPAVAAEQPAAEAPAAEAPSAKAEEAKPTELDPKAAAAEKSTARRALENGKLQTAIEAGEKSVALDPTDGEAWLLLGAAYQEKGRIADARRCYTACVKQGKRGPLNECSAMLR